MLLVATTALAQVEPDFIIEDSTLYERTGSQPRIVATLATDNDFFLGFGPTYTIDRSGKTIAYIGEGGSGHALCIYRSQMDSPVLFYSGSDISGWSKPVFSPSGRSLVFTVLTGIYRYDIDNGFLWPVTFTDKMDRDPFFLQDEQHIYFYRGNTFEFIFSGHLYRVAADGAGAIERIPEVLKKYPPEDLRGYEEEREKSP